MQRKISFLFAVVLSAALLLAACGGEAGDGDGQVESNRPQPPAEYAGKTNPHQETDQQVVDSGNATYQMSCATCHGAQGMGDGPSGQALNPPASDLASTEAEMSDAYMYWRIAEGGAMAPFSSAMPAWKGILSEDQIWEVVTYIRTLG